MNTSSNVCIASVKRIPVCHYKMQVLVGLVRGKNAKDAILQMQFSKKSGAYYLGKLLSSCVANGIQKGFDPAKLVVKIAVSDKEQTFRRFMACGRGRSTRIEKRYSSLSVVLEEVSGESASLSGSRVKVVPKKVGVASKAIQKIKKVMSK